MLANNSSNAKTFDVRGLKGSHANVFVTDANDNLSTGNNYTLLKQFLPVNGGTAAGVSVPARTVVFVETTSNGVTREVWTGRTGSALSNVDWNTSPNQVNRLTSLESGTNITDNFGERLRGYITAPESGQYTFWVSGDDAFDFNISTDSSPSNLGTAEANSSGYTARQDWLDTDSKKFTVTLTAGNRYYFEARHKEGTGGDNFAVAWTRPSQHASGVNPAWPREVIPNHVLTPYNLASGRTATASSSENTTTRAASKATDSDGTTRWSSGYATNASAQWIYVGLGSQKSISRVVLNWEAAYAADYQIQYSNSANGPWTTFSNGGTVVGNNTAGWKTHTFTAATAQFVRINMTKIGPYNNYSLFDFEVYT